MPIRRFALTPDKRTLHFPICDGGLEINYDVIF